MSNIAVEQVAIDPEWSARRGYDSEFLGITVPPPRLSDAMLLDTASVAPQFRVNGDPHLLAYYHFSIVMSASRRTAWYSAANIDGERRFDLGKRTGDRWFRDDRIAPDAQLDQQAFESGIDRGHITRREDVAWGATIEEARKANDDTFHFTNCSLQSAPFNRGKDRWQGLELFLLERKALKEKRRLSVITGPAFAAHDPAYQNQRMTYSVRCPLQFWKVCVIIRRDGTTSATAFVLGQPDIETLPGFESTFDVVAAQVTLANLERKTGLDFGGLKAHDAFSLGGPAGALEETRYKIINTFDDVVA